MRIFKIMILKEELLLLIFYDFFLCLLLRCYYLLRRQNKQRNAYPVMLLLRCYVLNVIWITLKFARDLRLVVNVVCEESGSIRCSSCDKEVRSYRAIEDAVPDEWVIDPEDMDPERKDDGSIVLKEICPDCSN